MNETVVFIPVTTGSELKKRCLKTIQRAKVKVAVMEVPGTSVKRKVQRSDPVKSRVCGDKEMYMVCANGGKGENCRSTVVTNEVRCKRCDRKYFGRGMHLQEEESIGEVL